MDTCFVDLKTYNKGQTIRKVMSGGGGGWGIFAPREVFYVLNFPCAKIFFFTSPAPPPPPPTQ